MDKADKLCTSPRAEKAASLEEFAQKIADSAARLPRSKMEPLSKFVPGAKSGAIPLRLRRG